MKLTFTFLLVLFSSSVFAQYSDLNFYIGFDGHDYSGRSGSPTGAVLYDSIYVRIDTTATNKWKVGHPSKSVFTAAYSGRNAIVTDTLLPCSINDTSIFTLSIPKNLWEGFDHFSFIYKLDIDTGDQAFVERSDDTGKTWVNFLTDSVTSFSTASPGYSISGNWDSISSYLKFYPYNSGNFIFRFTFISGPSAKQRDGWMIDNFRFGYHGEGVDEINRTISASVSPNPATANLSIKYSLQQRENLTIEISNFLGQKVKEVKVGNALAGIINIPVNALPPGVYFYTLKTPTAQTSGKILVQH